MRADKARRASDTGGVIYADGTSRAAPGPGGNWLGPRAGRCASHAGRDPSPRGTGARRPVIRGRRAIREDRRPRLRGGRPGRPKEPDHHRPGPSGDGRRSVEERYDNHAGYVAAVRDAAATLVDE